MNIFGTSLNEDLTALRDHWRESDAAVKDRQVNVILNERLAELQYRLDVAEALIDQVVEGKKRFGSRAKEFFAEYRWVFPKSE